jgi:hypothetical protein
LYRELAEAFPFVSSPVDVALEVKHREPCALPD